MLLAMTRTTYLVVCFALYAVAMTGIGLLLKWLVYEVSYWTVVPVLAAALAYGLWYDFNDRKRKRSVPPSDQTE